VEALVLASGSSGNAVLVTSGNTSVLVDAGVSALQIRLRLEAFDRSPDDIDAILLTHEHSDHVRGLDVFLRRHREAPVWTTHGTWSKIDVHSNGGGELSSGKTVRFGSLNVTPVATSHDAAEPLAYVFDDGDHSAAVCTDTGIVTPLLEQRLQGCELLLLETNHDPRSLSLALETADRFPHWPPLESPELRSHRPRGLQGPEGGRRDAPLSREQLPKPGL